MRRALAVLGAVAMVVAAVLVRQQIDDGDDDGGSGGEASGSVVVCARDLAEVCEALPDDVEVRLEDAAATAAAIADGSLAEDVASWLTTSAWLEVVESRAQQPVDGEEVLGRSRVVAAVDRARVEAVRGLCGDEVWRCLGDRADEPWGELGGDPRWGQLRTGLPDADSAVGLAVLGAVTAGYFGTADFAANDFGAGEFPAWLSRLAAAARGDDPDPVGTLVTRRGTYTAAAGPLVHAARLGDRVAVLEPPPEVRVEVVLVPLDGDGAGGEGALRDALEGRGWSRAEGAAQPRYKPGVLAALHTLWTEVT